MVMDLAGRLHTRSHAAPYLERETSNTRDESSGESESNYLRRKFQRTTNNSSSSLDSAAFRKPSLPASATRTLERESSLSQRRKSVLRDVRVPSGPREYPSPGRRNVSLGSSNPQSLDNTRAGNIAPNLRTPLAQHDSEKRALLLNAHAEAVLSKPAPLDSEHAGHRNNRSTETFSFLPDINFDDFQTSLQSHDGNALQLSDFSSVVGEGRRLLSRDINTYGLSKDSPLTTPALSHEQLIRKRAQEQQRPQGVGRTASLKQRMAPGRSGSGSGSGSNGLITVAKDSMRPPDPQVGSLRDRRKSSAPQTGAGLNYPPPATSKPPRKSMGPGFLPGSRNVSADSSLDDAGFELASRPFLPRTSSISKARRTTLHVAGSALANMPRLSSLNTTAQLLSNSKPAGTQGSGRNASDTANGASTAKPGRPNPNRGHSPTLSNNRRQSTVQSGRASGLGARTISPTDAKRLQRLSTAYAPPLPKPPQPKPQTNSQDEVLNSSSTYRLPDFSRLAQPSPSFIPRKTGDVTPSSARDSFDARAVYSSADEHLLSKASYSSLVNTTSSNASNSRLPTPRVRQTTPSQSATTQFTDQYTDNENDEIVPPVPAIPKAYESPKDYDRTGFFSSSSSAKTPQIAGLGDPDSFEPALESATFIPPNAVQQSRVSLDNIPPGSPAKRPGDFMRPRHKRTLTSESSGGVSVAGIASRSENKPLRAVPDSSGRLNANLQPIRLPPLNIASIASHRARQPSIASLPRSSQDIDARDGFANNHTPEPRRAPKTPSTPMTASKATFTRRQEGKASTLRSASSHFNLREVLSMHDDGSLTANPWDTYSTTPEPNSTITNDHMKQRNTVTPFSSGSLPKGSGELLRTRNGKNLDHEDEYSLNSFQNQQPNNARPRFARGRAQTSGTISSVNSNTPQTPSSIESPVVESNIGKDDLEKKDKEPSSAGGLRRKLSLSWRRASSKNATHATNKTSPTQQDERPADKERNRLVKKKSEMPPPRLPASSTWSGDLPTLPSISTRPNLLPVASGHARQASSGQLAAAKDMSAAVNGQPKIDAYESNAKLVRVQSEQVRPLANAQDMRWSSWSYVPGTSANRPAIPTRVVSSEARNISNNGSVASAYTKDKDDLAADEEMQRLSRKRKDVDTAARESEELKKRALAVAAMTTEQVLHDRRLTGGSSLNVFERGEIVDYEKDGVYFTGSRSARKVVGALEAGALVSSADSKDAKGGSNNFGYDDERGDYNIVLGDHLAYRYEVVDVLGKGSFGQVVRCVDHKEGRIVAVKIIRNKKRFHQQALVEVGILGKLKEWDPEGTYATLSVTGSFYFRNHLCIVTPCLSINLYELIRAHNFVGFQMPLIRRFARQLLACLTLLQAKRIIHCDLKPENILLCEARKADVRVIDFGSSCREEEKVYTYIQSRFYRSPEVILGSSYGLGIDMWSFGCILAELWTGYPLFPGENEQEQLACIMEIFGPPDRHLVDKCTRKKLFFDSVGKPRVTVSSKGRRRRPSSKTLQQALKTEDEAFIDFLSRCLRWDPDRRLKPSEAVSHPFITNQQFNTRQGAPDDFRRTNRPRPVGETVPPNSASSPVKRSGNAFAQQSQISGQTASTVVRDRGKIGTAGAASTAPRAAAVVNSLNPSLSSIRLPSVSPVKANPNRQTKDTGDRRSSMIATAGAAAVAGNKRASNGAILGSEIIGLRPTTTANTSTTAPNKLHSGNLAAIAARESMAGTLQGPPSSTTSNPVMTSGNAVGTGRWRV